VEAHLQVTAVGEAFMARQYRRSSGCPSVQSGQQLGAIRCLLSVFLATPPTQTLQLPRKPLENQIAPFQPRPFTSPTSLFSLCSLARPYRFRTPLAHAEGALVNLETFGKERRGGYWRFGGPRLSHAALSKLPQRQGNANPQETELAQRH
jgi:hypothetical protein